MKKLYPLFLLLPWALIIVLDQISGPVGKEMLLVGSGFLALLFAGLLFLLLLPLPGDRSFLMRRVLGLLLLLTPLVLLPGPWKILFFAAGGALLLRLLPGWQKIDEEVVRLEPIFFLIVGIKVAIVALLLL